MTQQTDNNDKKRHEETRGFVNKDNKSAEPHQRDQEPDRYDQSGKKDGARNSTQGVTPAVNRDRQRTDASQKSGAERNDWQPQGNKTPDADKPVFGQNRDPIRK